MMIVIDPGHGGSDPGVVSGTVEEAYINLKVAKKVAELLDAAGKEVKLTRDADRALSLPDRAQIANESNADINISIHCNSVANGFVSGIETYHFPSSKEGKMLAEKMQYSLQRMNRKNRGVKSANFQVLRRTAMPAVLVELGFLTNPVERHLLQQKSYQYLLAECIVEALA